MQFDQVVFYGRLGHQALTMFNLDSAQLRGARVLDCAGGPGSLSALLRANGVDVMAVDPLYALTNTELKQRALADLDAAMATLSASQDIRPEFNLIACRQEHIQALDEFLIDRNTYPDRYIEANLPQLPFNDQSFDLVLCGHLLFSYAPHSTGGLMQEPGLDLAWHRQALLELQRISSGGIRLYPAHTIQRQARRHEYAHALLAELPPDWQGDFYPSAYDQGHDGCTDGLALQRSKS